MNIKFGKKDGFRPVEMFIVFKSALAFFFLFFLHGTFKRRTKLSHVAYNVLWLGEVPPCTNVEL